MERLFDGLPLCDFHGDALRNIKSLRVSEHLFDDLSRERRDWDAATAAEIASKPPYSPEPIITRPFEEALYLHAIEYPFLEWAASRYTDGSYGVWYGADTLETTVHETVHHWRRMIEAAEGFTQHDAPIVGERQVFRVRADAALLDFRGRIADYPGLVAPGDYRFTQEVGRRVHREGHPGIIARSAHCEGEMYAVFRRDVLSNPRNYCYLTYRLEPGDHRVKVERTPGRAWMTVPAN